MSLGILLTQAEMCGLSADLEIFTKCHLVTRINSLCTGNKLKQLKDLTRFVAVAEGRANSYHSEVKSKIKIGIIAFKAFQRCLMAYSGYQVKVALMYGKEKTRQISQPKDCLFLLQNCVFPFKMDATEDKERTGTGIKAPRGNPAPSTRCQPRGPSLPAGGPGKAGPSSTYLRPKKKNTPRLHTAAPRWLSDSLPPAPAVTRKAGEQTPLAAPATRGGRERGRPPRSPGAVPEPRSPKTPSRSQSWSRSRFQPAPPGPTRPQHGGSPRPGSSRPGVGGGAGSERRRHGAVAQCCPQRAPWGLGPAFGVVVLLLDGSCSVVVAGSDKWALSCAS